MFQTELRIVIMLGVHTTSTMIMGEHFLQALQATGTTIACYFLLFGVDWISRKNQDDQTESDKENTKNVNDKNEGASDNLAST